MVNAYVKFKLDGETYELTLPNKNISEYFLTVGIYDKYKEEWARHTSTICIDSNELDFSFHRKINLAELNDYLLKVNEASKNEQQLIKLITKANGNSYSAFCYALNNYNDYTYFPATYAPEKAGAFILENVFHCTISRTRLRDAVNLKKIADEALMRALMYKVGDYFVINKADMTQCFLDKGGFDDEK